ncbi:MAG TPA: hypothetical protein PLN56_04190 [Methanoregulaceae archaeon]|nr:MAG: hypothetical protein IPI71_08110 [Methanolinea sp.]HON81213.1 hypothetical protein [Methanoregulaceae archaeon]HPD10182.1 hypothetical protein [Methanoregulaceae archaeon]HRT15187.1 hypothetical protein [Methanoregulaceae archaeon]HRU30696.1 hypothetical protein [Methanoregulaceae archaeon]
MEKTEKPKAPGSKKGKPVAVSTTPGTAPVKQAEGVKKRPEKKKAVSTQISPAGDVTKPASPKKSVSAPPKTTKKPASPTAAGSAGKTVKKKVT